MEAVKLVDFGFSYPGSAPVLDGVNATIEEGSFTMLVGSTGSGKTTLLRCLKPELVPTGKRSGSIEMFGFPEAGWSGEGDSDPLSSSQTGYVAQNPENQIVCDSVWHELAFGLENLGMPQEVMRRRVAEVAYFFGMEPWFRRDTAGLSGGQKQMLNLAGALVMQPRLLLLDEPTSQLDPVTTRNFLHLLFRVNRELGITVIVATHSPETMAEYATSCLCVRDGALSPVDLAGFRHEGTTLSERVDAPEPLPDGGARDSGMSEVFFRYARGAEWVLRGTSLDITAGTIHALVGGNGSGKTTMLNLFAGVLKPERGCVDNGHLREQALLPQNPRALFVCDTVVEELEEWKDRCGYADKEVETALGWAGLKGWERHHPYDLSGGQQQKLALAKILLTRPRLMLLDEPTKGLDAESRYEVARMLVDLRAQGVTMILSTHDLPFVLQIADRVSLLFDGEITCTEDAAGFFSGNFFYRPMSDGFARLWADRKEGLA